MALQRIKELGGDYYLDPIARVNSVGSIRVLKIDSQQLSDYYKIWLSTDHLLPSLPHGFPWPVEILEGTSVGILNGISQQQWHVQLRPKCPPV